MASRILAFLSRSKPRFCSDCPLHFALWLAWILAFLAFQFRWAFFQVDLAAFFFLLYFDSVREVLIAQITWPSGEGIKLNTFCLWPLNETTLGVFIYKERVHPQFGLVFLPRAVLTKKCAYETQQKATEEEIQSIRTWHDYFLFLFIYGVCILFYFLLLYLLLVFLGPL